MNCTHYSDHEADQEAPLSQTHTVGLCGYTVYNSPSVVLYCHLLAQLCNLEKNVSGYVCNHGSPSGERDTASPRGRYGERLQRDSCLKIHM